MRHALIALLAGFFLAGGLTIAHAEKNKFEQELDKEAAVFAYLRHKIEPADPELKKLAYDLVDQTQKGGYQDITVAELKAMLDAKKPMVIIDTMPEEAFKAEHIPGARQFLFPIPDMAEWDAGQTGGKTVEDFKALLGPDKQATIVVYCGFVKCTRSHNGAMWARKLGYENVLRVPGGGFAWKGAGYPFESAK